MVDAPGRRRGGARKNAGRPRTGRCHDAPHRRRPPLSRRHPVHVVLRAVAGLPRLRERRFYRALRTPPSRNEDTRSRMKTVLRVREDGSAEGETDVEVTGVFAGGARALLKYLPPNREEEIVRKILSVFPCSNFSFL